MVGVELPPVAVVGLAPHPAWAVPHSDLVAVGGRVDLLALVEAVLQHDVLDVAVLSEEERSGVDSVDCHPQVDVVVV